MSDAAAALRPGVILDRDATLIDVVRDEEAGVLSVAFHPSQLVLLPSVVEGLRLLQDHGFALAIATNQPGPAKGQFSAQAVERTNQALVELLASHGVRIEAVEVCMHHPEGGPHGDPALAMVCECRKPKPGMLLNLCRRLALDPAQSFMIGDSPGDVLAAHAAGLRAGLVFLPNRCEICPLRGGPTVRAEIVAERLDAVAQQILGLAGT